MGILLSNELIYVSRIAAGVVTAIGFLGAGIIFVRHDNVSGITTAAGLWATVGVGIAIGAGMYIVGVVTTVLLLLVQMTLHSRRFQIKARKSGSILMTMQNPKEDIHNYIEMVKQKGIVITYMEIKRNETDCELLLQVSFPPGFSIEALFCEFSHLSAIQSIDIED